MYRMIPCYTIMLSITVFTAKMTTQRGIPLVVLSICKCDKHVHQPIWRWGHSLQIAAIWAQSANQKDN